MRVIDKLMKIWIRRIRRTPTWFTDDYGVRCLLFPDDNLASLLSSRQFFDDEAVLALTPSLLRTGAVVLDVGSHWGEYTLFVAKHLIRGTIHMFEPTRESFERARRNIAGRANRDVDVVCNQCAVGESDANIVLHKFPPRFASWNTRGIYPMFGEDGEEILRMDTENVGQVSVDAYCREHQIHEVDLLKVDVEGYELEVVMGCRELMHAKRIRRMILEVSLTPLSGRGKSPRELLHAVTGMGYSLFRILAKGQIGPAIDESQSDWPDFANYLALPAKESNARYSDSVSTV